MEILKYRILGEGCNFGEILRMNSERLSDTQKVVAISKCDYCGEDIFAGEKVKLCGDGTVVHIGCVKDYAVAQLDPLTLRIEEVVE